jgi:hypothetical protein
LQQVGNAYGSHEGVGRCRSAEVVAEDTLPHQAEQSAQQDTGGDQNRRAAGARGGGQLLGGGGRVCLADGFSNSRCMKAFSSFS